MIFQSRITLKGRDRDLIVSKSIAEKVQEVWADNTKARDFLIQLKTPSTMFLKGDIRFIDLINDLKDADFSEEVRMSREEETDERSRILRLSAEDRATNTTIFDGMYVVSSGGVATPPEIRSQVISIQADFFRKNPRRTTCDPTLYLPLIPKNGREPDHKLWSHTPGMFQLGYLRIVERAVLRDIQLSK